MTIGEDGIDVDFTGTSGPSPFGINVPHCYTEAYATFGINCIVAPQIPNNQGSLSVIRIRAPEGCILNARDPAPVSVRHVIGQMLPDVMFGCLHQALPGRVPAEGTSCLWNLSAMGGAGRVDGLARAARRGKPFNVMSFHSGGTGARPGKDGLSATAFPSGVRNMPVEVTESMSPLVVWRKEYRPDSGGAGEFRGGLGQRMEVESTRGGAVRDQRLLRPHRPPAARPGRREQRRRGRGQARRVASSCAARVSRRSPRASD